MENQINIRKVAEKNGYKVRIYRHGVYTDYSLVNSNGKILIERNAIGMTPRSVHAEFEIRIPEKFDLYKHESPVLGEYWYTVIQRNENKADFASLSEQDIQEIIELNK